MTLAVFVAVTPGKDRQSGSELK